MEKTLIALDIDNTSNNLDNQIAHVFLKNLKYRWNSPIEFRIHKRTTWNYTSMFPDLSSENITELLWYEYREEIFNPQEVIPNGWLLPFLDRCFGSNIEITFVSDNQLRDFVNLWVEYWIPKQLYDGRMVGRKESTKATWLIDDDPRIPQRMIGRPLSVLTVSKPWNERHHKLFLIKNLEEAWPIIHAQRQIPLGRYYGNNIEA